MKASREQEKRVAEGMGGTVQPGSGSGWMRKGDVSTPEWLVECKRTDAKSYRLTKDTIQKIRREAMLENKEWAVLLDISGIEVAVLDIDTFLSLVPPAGDR